MIWYKASQYDTKNIVSHPVVVCGAFRGEKGGYGLYFLPKNITVIKYLDIKYLEILQVHFLQYW